MFDHRPTSVVEMVSWLTYCNYKHNRMLSPEVTPAEWARIFGPQTVKLEEYYQKELELERRNAIQTT